MPYVLIDETKIKEFDPEGKLKTLPEDTPDKMQRLEGKANDLLSEKKRLQVDFDEYKVDSKKKINDLHQNKGVDSGEEVAKIQSMLDDAMKKNGDWETKYNGLIEDNRNKTIEGEAARLAASMTKDVNRADLLKQQIRNRITLDGDNFSVLDEKGNPTISTVEELSSQIREQYPFLVDGSQASGGGARGGSGGAEPTKKFNEYSGAELSKIRQESPEKYDRLKADFQTNIN